MTFGEILAQIITEITGLSMGQVMGIVNSIEKAFPGQQRLDEVVPDDKVDELIQELRREKPAIIAQLLEFEQKIDRRPPGNA